MVLGDKARKAGQRKSRLTLFCRQQLPFLLAGLMLSTIASSSYITHMSSLSSLSQSSETDSSDRPANVARNEPATRRKHVNVASGGGLTNVDRWVKQSHAARKKTLSTKKESAEQTSVMMNRVPRNVKQHSTLREVKIDAAKETGFDTTVDKVTSGTLKSDMSKETKATSGIPESKTKEDVIDAIKDKSKRPHADVKDTNVAPTESSDSADGGHREVKSIVNDTKPKIQDFVKQPGVVIAFKIHGPPHVIQLKQSLCLLTKAYNNRPQYDILLFVTDPLSNLDVQELRDIAHPAKLILETDKKTLSRHLMELTPNQTATLLDRCSKNSTDELFWWTRCCEEHNRGECMPLAYNWQAEFRSKWIWYNKELAKYKWMMWYDSDAMATRVWEQDPVAFAIRNDLKMLFDHFPQGWRASEELKGMMQDAYGGDYICDAKLFDGHLDALRKDCAKPKIPQIHGFFHITNLDFYRSDANMRWFNNMIGDRKFSRLWDDQLAVTVPAAVLAANKSWDMNENGIQLDVYHNQHFDGDRKRRHRGGGFVHWWQTLGNASFPEAVEDCGPLVKNSG